MAVGDEPDFGFLNGDDTTPDSTDQFSFNDPNVAPTSKPNATPDTPPTTPPTPNASPDADQISPRKLKRPTRKAAAATSTTAATDAPSPEPSAKRPDKTKSKRSDTGGVAASGIQKQTKPLQSSDTQASADTVPKSQFLALAIFAALISVALLLQLLGVLQLGNSHQLESLPDVAPLKEGEFQAVPETASLPTGHQLKLGQQQRFGDIVFTPTKVVREPLQFAQMTSGQTASDLKSHDVLKLYFTVKNVANNVAFPPWDVALMTHRSPAEGIDESTKANSWLQVSANGKSQRILNYFHSPKSNFNIVDFQSRVALQPTETRSTFVASSEGVVDWLTASADLRWRIQLRKGINSHSNRSVTTLVDVMFREDEIQM